MTNWIKKINRSEELESHKLVRKVMMARMVKVQKAQQIRQLDRSVTT